MKWFSFLLTTKGQEISEWKYEVVAFPNERTNSALSIQGRIFQTFRSYFHSKNKIVDLEQHFEKKIDESILSQYDEADLKKGHAQA